MLLSEQYPYVSVLYFPNFTLVCKIEFEIPQIISYSVIARAVAIFLTTSMCPKKKNVSQANPNPQILTDLK